jgi:CcmD family protein
VAVEKQFLEFVFFAYSAVFILIFLFVTNVWRRTRSLQQQLDAMREDEDAEGES